MFCHECGAQVAEGSKFCAACGSPTRDIVHEPVHPSPTPTHPPGAAGAGGTSSFIRSGAGIALLAILGVAVIAGVTIGLIFALKDGGGAVRVELAEIWEEYESIAREADEEQVKIDLTSGVLAENRENLRKTRTEIEALRKTIEALDAPRAAYWKEKYDQLSGSIRYYDEYVAKLDGLYSTLSAAVLAGNLAARVESIEASLAELATLAKRSSSLANEFLEDNEDVAAGETFDPDIFTRPDDISAEVKGATGTTMTTGDDSDSSGSEGIDPAVIAGVPVLEDILSLYKSGGWGAITGYMAPELLAAYRSAPVSWDQVSYDVLDAVIVSGTVDDDSDEVAEFTVRETLDDGGERVTTNSKWYMVVIDGAWKLYDYEDQFGESKL